MVPPLAGVLAWCALAAAPCRATAESVGTSVREASDHAANLRAHDRSLDALGDIAALRRTGAYAPADTAQKALAHAARSASSDPFVAARARWELAQLDQLRGETRLDASDLGLLDAWQLAPAEDLAASACDEVEPPELASPVWTEAGGLAPLGVLDLGRFIATSTPAALFARTTWRADRPQTIALRLAATHPTTVFLDGQLVGTVDESRTTPPPEVWDHSAFGLKVSSGTHELVVRICVDGSPPVRLIARTTDAVGRPVHLPATDLAAELATDSAAGRAHPSPRGPIARAAVADPVQTLLAALQRTGDGERRAGERIRLVRALFSLGVDATDRLGDTWDERLERAFWTSDSHVAHAIVSAAVEERPDDPRAWRWLARLELERLRYFPAAHALAHAEAASPHDPEIAVLRARLASENQWNDLAAGLVESALRRYPNIPQLAFEAAALAHLQSDTRAAQGHVAQLRPIAWFEHSPLHWLYELALSQGRTTDALRWAERLVDAFPDAASLRLQFAEVAIESGQRAQAEQIVSQIPDVNLWHPSVLSQAAQLAYRIGDNVRALQWAEAGLHRRPNDSILRALRRHIAPDRTSFEAQYRREPLEWSRANPPAPGVETEFLLDQTVIQVQPNGLSTAWHQRILRANDVSSTRARTLSILYDGYRQSLDLVRAEVWSPDGAVRPVSRREETLLSEEWYGLYYDQRRHTLVFDELSAGDVLVAEYRLHDAADSASTGRFGELWVAADVAPKREVVLSLRVPDGVEVSAALHDRTGQAAFRLEEGDEDGFHVRTWRLRDVPALAAEERAPGLTERSIFVHASNFSGPTEVARFYRALIRGQAESNQRIAEHVRKIAGDLPTPVEQLAALHADLVRTFRYVGLEFGIHGYKPYACPLVFARKFGDCKDQSTLLMVMLRELGIESHLALVRTRSLGRIPSSPASLAAFNHAVLYVPSLQLWVDPTATWHALGELPTEIQGASALIVEDDGGTWVVIPEDPPTANTTTREFDIALQSNGTAQIRGTWVNTGLFSPDWREELRELARRDRVLQSSIADWFPGASLDHVSLTGVDELGPPVSLEFEARAPLGTPRAPDANWSLRPSWVPNWLDGLSEGDSRQSDLLLDFAFTQVVRTRLHAPPGYALDATPLNERAECPWARAEVQLYPDGDSWVHVVKMAVEQTRIPARSYGEWLQFLRRVRDLSQSPLRVVARAPGGATPEGAAP